MEDLHKLRNQIARTRAEIAAVKNALPPMAGRLDQAQRAIRESGEPLSRHIDTLAAAVAIGREPITAHSLFGMRGDTDAIAKLALSMAVAAYGDDRLLSDIRERTNEMQDAQTLRLSSQESAERLTKLSRRLYELELSEEYVLSGSTRRPECNPAAVLGIPAAVAEQFDLLTLGAQ